MLSENLFVSIIDLEGGVITSSTMAALLVNQVSEKISLAEAYGLNPEQVYQFQKWLTLVKKRNLDLSWSKILPLAPVIEIGLRNRNVTLSTNLGKLQFQKLVRADGVLTGILAVAFLAEAGSKIVAHAPEYLEPNQNKLEIRDVLALSANPPETLGTFFDDAAKRLERATQKWDAFLTLKNSEEKKSPQSQIENPWHPQKCELNGESVGQYLFRDLHMIKGNAGAFGFASLAASAQDAEDILETLKKSNDKISIFTRAISGLRNELEEICRAFKLIAGEGQDAMSRILKWKLERLIKSASEIDPSKLEPSIQNFLDSTKRLPFLSPAYLARKYRNLVERIAFNLGKKVSFRVTSNTGDIHPECFSRVDEALVHILRNMVDHGIEFPSEREILGKGDAQIGIEYSTEEDRIFIRIVDDGRGMDPAMIAARGISLGLLSQKDSEGLDDTGKLGLIFQEGFTTRDDANLISGRGLGLSLAAHCVADQGGNIYVYSKPGEGARFAIELPHIGTKILS